MESLGWSTKTLVFVSVEGYNSLLTAFAKNKEGALDLYHLLLNTIKKTSSSTRLTHWTMETLIKLATQIRIGETIHPNGPTALKATAAI